MLVIVTTDKRIKRLQIVTPHEHTDRVHMYLYLRRVPEQERTKLMTITPSNLIRF